MFQKAITESDESDEKLLSLHSIPMWHLTSWRQLNSPFITASLGLEDLLSPSTFWTQYPFPDQKAQQYSSNIAPPALWPNLSFLFHL